LGLVVVTPPAEEPVTAAELKAYSRIDHATEDTLVSSLITAARRHLELLTDRAFITQTLRYSLPWFPAGDLIRLPRPPLQSISSVQYTDINGVTQTAASTVYRSDTTVEPALLTVAYGQSWPSTKDETFGAVLVNYVAGYGLAASVPADLKHAIKILAGYWFERPELAGKGDWPDLPPVVRRLAWTFWHGTYAYTR
jgi:uncharacterized phiE125 gp8 family phage protein